MIFILRDKNKKPVAFSANKFIDEKLIIFLSTMVLPEFQGYGIAKKMQKIAGQKFLRDQILKNSLKFWKNFKSLYFAYRTPNPRLIKAVQKYNLALPIDNSKKISDKEKIIAKKVAEIFSPNLEFEEKNFVIKSALLKTNPELIYKKDQIPWSGDEKIDKFCENHLDYKNQKGNLFVIVGHINFFQKIFFACIPL
ncbi:MAG: hypothetical protein PHI77_00210 [Candidatus Pacebacteria bacterium]|nr:hypothetical protein [Candidatus Paceibacterota bacterium]